MGIKFSNNASANIVRALTPTATSVSVTPDKGDLFPSLTEGDYFYATLAGNNGLEIVKVINRVNDTMTIVRAQDDTTALSFDTGDLFELRIVAADFNDTFSEVNDKLEASLSSKAPIFHASSSDEFGTGTSTEYGHNKLSDATDSNLGADSGTAATPKAVKTAKAEAVTTATKALTAFAETQAAKDAEQDAVIGTIREDTVAAAQDAARSSYGESGSVTLEGVAAELGEQGLRFSNYLPLTGGTLTGNLVLPSNVYITGDSTTGAVYIGGSSAINNGGRLALYAGDNASTPGEARLSAMAADGTQKNLRLKTDGTALWDGKPILTLVESWRSGDNWYRKWSDGWIEQGGAVQTSTSDTTVTLHKALTQDLYTIQLTPQGYGSDIRSASWKNRYTTNFTCCVVHGDQAYTRSWVLWAVQGY